MCAYKRGIQALNTLLFCHLTFSERFPSPNILILRSHTFPVSTQSRADIDGPTHFLTSFTMYVVKRREREMGKKSGEKRERGILISAATTTTADVEYI